MGVVTRAEVRSVLTTIVPYAPSSIIDAVSGFVEILVNYAPLSPSDDVCAVTFSICMKFLDECYNGASPRDVFMDVIHSMSCDLLQPFPEYTNIYDLDLRSELIKELSFRWCLYNNISNHVDYAARPQMSVQELEDYFSDLDICNVPLSPSTNSTDEDLEDHETVSDEGFDSNPSSKGSEDVATQLPPVLASTDVSLLPPEQIKFEPFQHTARPARIAEITSSSNGSHIVRVPRSIRNRRPLSFYRQFYAEWKNGLRRRSNQDVPVKLLLFTARKPKWRKLEGYDVTIPWRPKV